MAGEDFMEDEQEHPHDAHVLPFLRESGLDGGEEAFADELAGEFPASEPEPLEEAAPYALDALDDDGADLEPRLRESGFDAGEDEFEAEESSAAREATWRPEELEEQETSEDVEAPRFEHAPYGESAHY